MCVSVGEADEHRGNFFIHQAEANRRLREIFSGHSERGFDLFRALQIQRIIRTRRQAFGRCRRLRRSGPKSALLRRGSNDESAHPFGRSAIEDLPVVESTEVFWDGLACAWVEQIVVTLKTMKLAAIDQLV